MKGLRFVAITSVLASVAALAVQSPAQALDFDSTALYARYPYYGLGSPGPMQGPSCFNLPSNMPAGRQFACSMQPISHPSTGVYKITVLNGAPLPSSTQDTGYAVFVNAVGGNAHCAETAITWSSTNLTSTVTCVNPSGNNVDSNFVWFYRSDSAEYALGQIDFVYARINRGAPTQPVAAQTYDPFVGLNQAGPPTSQKFATGRYRVTFPNVNVDNSFGHVDPTTGMNNVIVQNTCSNDTSLTCKKAVCIPTAWTAPAAQGSNTTVDVSCYSGTSLVDVDFRVFIGNESHNSQELFHFGWLNSPNFTANSCFGTSAFKHRNEHESPLESYPTLPLTVCKTGTGAYNVPFANHGFYHTDAVSAIVTSRTTGGVYCTVGSISCGDSQCIIPPDPAVTVRCYNSSGALTNALWNLSVVY